MGQSVRMLHPHQHRPTPRQQLQLQPQARHVHATLTAAGLRPVSRAARRGARNRNDIDTFLGQVWRLVSNMSMEQTAASSLWSVYSVRFVISSNAVFIVICNQF